MTLLHFLRQLPANPLDATSPLLYVAEGDLTTEGQRVVTSDLYKGYPYALLLGIADAPVQRYHGGTARLVTPAGVVLEMRPPASKAILTALWARAYQAPGFVDEVMPGVPLHEPLVYSNGVRPEASYQNPDWLFANLRFESQWRGRY